MKKQVDPFRPRNHPARMLYDAFQEEAAKRLGRPVEEWRLAELRAIWVVARDYAQQHGLRALTLEEVKRAGIPAIGHTDYSAKWAHNLAELLRSSKETTL